MLSPELLKRVESIFIRSKRRVNDVFSGEYESAFRGRGVEFEEYREYVPGDDVRQIDWNVTARMDRPFIKLFKEEREQTLFFLVDISRSQKFGRERDKLEISTEIAALLAYVATRSNDKVGLILFSDRIEKYIPPKKGRGHVWNIIATLLSHKPVGTKTSIREALTFFLKVNHRKTTSFLISDYYDDNFMDVMKVASLRHDMIVFRVVDELEKSFGAHALMDFVDLESGESFKLDGHHADKGLKSYQDDCEQLFTKKLGSYKVDYLSLSSHEDYVGTLLRYFMQRDKKR